MLLSRMDEVYLLVIHLLGEEAYGVPIRREVAKRTKKPISYGGLYFALDQLVRRGLVVKSAGDPTPVRGGRKRFYYSLTKLGKSSLKETYVHQRSLWKDVKELVFD